MSRLTRREPMGEIMSLRDQIDRMFWPGFLGRRIGKEEGLGASWMPAVDIREFNDTIEVTAELPGISPKRVDVSVEGNLLTIRGERRRDEIKENETEHRVEREYGVFERTFTLPRSAETERIVASFKDGVMTLTVPKRAEARPKAIKVNVSNK